MFRKSFFGHFKNVHFWNFWKKTCWKSVKNHILTITVTIPKNSWKFCDCIFLSIFTCCYFANTKSIGIFSNNSTKKNVNTINGVIIFINFYYWKNKKYWQSIGKVAAEYWHHKFNNFILFSFNNRIFKRNK